MVINISINKTLDDSVIVKKVSILFNQYFNTIFTSYHKEKKFSLIKTSAHK